MGSLEQASAVILASGNGSRLGELTRATPKPLLEFGGRPYVQYVIDWLLRKNIHDIVLTTHVHADQIQSFIANRPEYDGKVSTVREPALVSTVESAKTGLERAKKAASFLLTADNTWDVDLVDMHRKHVDSESAATVLLTGRPGVPNLGKVQVNENDRVVQMWPSAESDKETNGLRPGSTMGMYLLQIEAIMDAIEPQDSSIEREPMDRLTPNVQAYWNDGFFFDYGTPDNYQWLLENPNVITQYLQ